MTTLVKIRRLATTAVGPEAQLAVSEHPVKAASPRLHSRRPRPAADEAKPFLAGDFSSVRIFHRQVACSLYDVRHPRMNRRRPHPPLAMAICCLMCSSLALFVSTPRGEAALGDAVPIILGQGCEFSLASTQP